MARGAADGDGMEQLRREPEESRDDVGRRRAEAALRDSEQRYRMTIDFLEESIHVVDAELRIVLLNRAGERWMRGFGIEGDIVGRGIFEVFPFLPERVRDEYRRVFAGEGPVLTEETNVVDGREIATETRKIPVVERGRVVHAITVMRDVTEILRTQERLRQKEKLESLGQLAGGIAHDFNNQLTAILGFAELITRDAGGTSAGEYARLIAHTALRSAELTRQLLTFARQGPARAVPLDLHAVLGEVASLLGRIIDPRIAVRLRLDADRATTIGDPAQLENAFLNLALNARDAMPAGGELTIATDVVPDQDAGADEAPAWAARGGRLRVRVTDTGVGMGEEVRRRVFEPFYTTKATGQGTGMGLAAVYGTVSGHRATIQVASEPGRGTTFTLLFWLAGQGVDAPVAPPAAEPVPGRGHVLVVDDEPMVLHATARSLAALGYRVTERADGGEAVAWYRGAWRETDLVLLDVMMPGLGGAAVLAELRRINPAVRAILCTGHPFGAEEERLIVEGAAGFLEKPFTLAELARRVASMLPGAG